MSHSDSNDSDYAPSEEENNLSVEENSSEEIDELEPITQNDISAKEVNKSPNQSTSQDIWTNFLESVNAPKPPTKVTASGGESAVESTKCTHELANGNKQQNGPSDLSKGQNVDRSPLNKTPDAIRYQEATPSSADSNSGANEKSPTPVPLKRPPPEQSNKPPRCNPTSITDFKSLASIRKKVKVNTLEMTKNSWEQFKQEEYGQSASENGLTDMDFHIRGKDSYVDRMEFLSRTDNKRFEIEKNLRNLSRK